MFPVNTPQDIIEYCTSCTTVDDVIEKLKTNLDLFIKFFESFTKDPAWFVKNGSVVEKVMTHFKDLKKLSLAQARIVRETARIAHDCLKMPLLAEIGLDDVTFNFGTQQVLINSRLLCADSQYFMQMLHSGYKEGGKVVSLPVENYDAILAMKEFLETGKISTQETSILEKLVSLSHEYLIGSLAQYLGKETQSLSGDTLLEFLGIAKALNVDSLYALCFQFVEENFPGLQFKVEEGVITAIFNDVTPEMRDLVEFFDQLPSFSLKIEVECFGHEYSILKDTELAIYKRVSLVLFEMTHRAKEVDFSDTLISSSTLKALCISCSPFSSKPLKIEALNLKNTSLSGSAISNLIGNLQVVHSLNLENCEVDNEVLSEIAKMLVGRLESINLIDCPIGLEGIRTLVTVCPNLRELKLGYTNPCDTQLINDEIIRVVAEKSTKLEKLEIFGCKNVSPAALAKLVQKCPLISLTIIEDKEHEKNPQVTGLLLENISKYRPNIKELRLTLFNESSLREDLVTGFSLVSKSCHRMTVLSVYDQRFSSALSSAANFYFDQQTISNVIKNNPQMQSLHLGGDAFLNEHLELMAVSCPQLKSITLIGGFKDSSIKRFAQGCPDLKEVELEMPFFSDQALKYITDRCPKINNLCLFMTDLEA